MVFGLQKERKRHHSWFTEEAGSSGGGCIQQLSGYNKILQLSSSPAYLQWAHTAGTKCLWNQSEKTSLVTNAFFKKRFYLFTSRGKGREEGWEGEKHPSVASHRCPDWEPGTKPRNPGTCPDLESKQLSLREFAPNQPSHTIQGLMLSCLHNDAQVNCKHLFDILDRGFSHSLQMLSCVCLWHSHYQEESVFACHLQNLLVPVIPSSHYPCPHPPLL